MSTTDEARAEAERRYPRHRMNDTLSERQYAGYWAFIAGAEWQASRKVEAPANEREELATIEFARQAIDDAYPTSNYPEHQDRLDRMAAALRASQPVQVEVTDDMVEKAAEAAWGWLIPAGFDVEPWDEAGDADREAARAQMRLALPAALGGGE